MRLTARDRALLSFAAEHKLVLARQIAVLLRTASVEAANRRLLALRREGLLVQDRPFHEQPSCYQITRAGLGATDTDLTPPKAVDRAHYRHDVGVGWLWVAARAGAWGDVSRIVSERRMRSHDGSLDADARAKTQDLFGVRLGGVGPGGRARLHYPDLLLIDGAGHRIAIELELSAKQPRRLEEILGGYAIDARIDAVVYLVDRRSVAAAVRAATRRVGVEDLVHVQRLEWGAAALPTARGRARTRQRTATRTRQAVAER